EHKKHDGSRPLVGVNTFLPKEHAGDIVTEIELISSTPEEKAQQIANVEAFRETRNSLSPPAGRVGGEAVGEGQLFNGLRDLQQVARDRQNVFAALMEAVKTHTLGQISHALYDVGGE